MKKGKYDSLQLLWMIDRKYKTRAAFCRAAGIEPKTFYKEKSAGHWSSQTITKAVKTLNIPHEEIGFYFFAPIMQAQEARP